MEKNKGFAYACGWNVYYIRVLGICSVQGESVLERQRAWIWALLMALCVWIPQTASLPIIRHNFNMTIDCLATNFAIFLSIVKIIVLQTQRRVIGSMMTSVAKDWLEIRTKEEREAMMVTARISSVNSKISFSISSLGLVALVVSQLYVILVKGKDPEKDPRLAFGFLLESYFPFDTSSPFIFMPLWLGQAFSVWLVCYSYAGPDCLASMVVLHLCGELRLVRLSLRNLANETTVREPAKYWQRLRAIVRRHEQLNQWTQHMENLFSKLLLAQMLICSATFCFQGYSMVRGTFDVNGAPIPLPVLIFRVLYAAFTLEHLFVCCYVGDRLYSESTSLSNDFYATAWYNLAPKEARAFILVCQRSSIPLELTAGKFCSFNLQLFNNILKNSMGYLSMLMAMKDRLIK